jgi:transposase
LVKIDAENLPVAGLPGCRQIEKINKHVIFSQSILCILLFLCKQCVSYQVYFFFCIIMPKSKINEHLRWLIVERSLEGLSLRTIAGQLSISKSSVSRVFLQFQKYGCVEDLLPLGRSGVTGRSRILSIDDVKYLESLLKEKIDWYLWELQSEMELWLGRHISYCTIWRAIHRLGYTHKQVKISIYMLIYNL